MFGRDAKDAALFKAGIMLFSNWLVVVRRGNWTSLVHGRFNENIIDK